MIIQRFTLVVLLIFSFGWLFGQQNQDCTDAFNLVNTLTTLEDVAPLELEPLTGPGEMDNVRGIICDAPVIGIDTLGYFSSEDKVFWFSFHVATAGSFEMMITPSNLGGDFDFMVWEGSCPSNPCAGPIFCGWQGPTQPPFTQTGLSGDPALVASSTEIWEAIELQANTNYFVLVDHRCPFVGDCNDIGGTIEFGGTAQITSTRPEPQLLVEVPNDTSQVIPVCPGTSLEFRTDLINATEGSVPEFVWSAPADAVVEGTGEDVIVRFETISGDVCVELECPVNAKICWTVEVGEVPNLRATNPEPTTCNTLNVTDFVEDLNNVEGELMLFSSLQDAILQQNALPLEAINNRGTYWVIKVPASFCTATPVEIISNPLVPSLEVPAIQGACELPYDLNEVPIDELNGFQESGDLDILFYNTEADARNDVNLIADGLVNAYGEYWIRGETSDGCTDFASFELIDATPIFQTPATRIECDEFELTTINLVTENNTVASQVTFFATEAAAIDGSNPLTSTLITESVQVWGRAEIVAGCPGFVPIDIVINETIIDPIDPISFCGETYNLLDLPLNGADAYEFYTSSNDALSQTNPLISTEITSETTIWVRGENTTTGCIDTLAVQIRPADPSINPIPTVNACGNSFDLSSEDLVITEANNVPLNYTYYLTLADAIAGDNPFDGMVNASGTYYVRGVIENPAACFDIDSVMVNLIVPNIQQPGAQRLEDGQYDLADAGRRILDLETIERLTNLSYYADSLDAVNGMPELPSTIVTSVGVYWIRGELRGCPVIISQEVLPESQATIPLPMPPNFDLPCTGDCIDLLTVLSEEEIFTNNPNLTFYFFATEPQAEDGFLADTLSTPEVCTPSTIWIRGNDENGEFGVSSVTITEMELVTATLLSEDQIVCEENADQLTLNLRLNGTPPFEIQYSDGIESITDTIPDTTFQLPLNPAMTTTYSLESVVDANGCVGTATGTVTYTILERVAISNFERTCDLLQTEYILSFDISAGDIASLTIDGITGTLTGTQYISDPIPIAQGYSFSLADANGCAPLTQSGVHVCTCETEAAILDLNRVDVCVGDATDIIETMEGTLAPNDSKYYVLHDSPNNQLGEILAVQETPTFSFFNPLEIGTTYYVSAVITQVDDTGTPILDRTLNPCIGISRGTPVRFVESPEVTIRFERDTACVGEIVDLIFEMNAEGPFNIVLFDGLNTTDMEGIQNGHIERVTAANAVNYAVDYIEFSQVLNCFNDDPQATASLNTFPPLTYDNVELTCDSGGREFIISFTISGGDPNSYIVNGSADNIVGGVFESPPFLNESNYRFEISDGNNCDPIVIQDFGSCLCTADITTTITSVQDISCTGGNDGMVQAVPNNGLPPFSYRWNDGSTSDLLTDLSEGWVAVTMTDANDCERTDSFFVVSPTPISPEIDVNEPLCFGDDNGSIIVRNVNGGTRPFDFSFDGGEPSSNQLFGNLFADSYSIRIIDSKGCEYEETIELIDPDELLVSLANNTKRLRLGDSIEIDTRISEPDIEFVWESNTPLSCLDCLNPITSPTEVGIYSITITNSTGCTASDRLVIQVTNNKEFFAPNAFSPNGDGFNDTFGIFGGSQVVAINYLRVFNRWGAMLYERSSFGNSIPPQDGWDGLETNGENAPNGIYVYIAEVVFTDGTVEVITGDVALMR